MKRLFCLFLIAFICIFSGCEKKQDSLIVIDELNKEYENGELHSFLKDYSVEGNEVIFDCYLYIENTTEERKEFEIYGSYEEDVESGFILEQNMKATDTETKSDVFVLEPLEKKMFEVEFKSPKGEGADTKENRLLPEITVTER